MSYVLLAVFYWGYTSTSLTATYRTENDCNHAMVKLQEQNIALTGTQTPRLVVICTAGGG